jgi:orotidine-5'-phosphate decarboxylase
VSTIPIVALDVADQRSAVALIEELGASCRFYKVGAELFTACGPQIVVDVRERGAEVFLDLKYHDIPNTVAGAVRSAVALGVRLLTVHASGGAAMLRAAVEAVPAPARCAIYAVTVLTSLDATAVGSAWGRAEPLDVPQEVARLARLAQAGGVAGVVCSGREARNVKTVFGETFGVLIPGIRLSGGATHDQSRTVTPAEAAAAGANYVVVGRAVTGATDRVAAMREVCRQLQ